MTNPLLQYIENGRISIDNTHWIRLNILYNQSQIIEFFKEVILDQTLSLPYQDISYSDAVDDMKKLVDYDDKLIYVSDSGRYKYDYRYSNNLGSLDIVTTGSKVSNFYMQKNRFETDCINSPSPVRVWQSSKFLNSYLGALWSMKVSKIDTSVLRSLLSLRKYIAGQFRPVVAKYIYEKYGGNTVLDISSGWGDRLVGFLSSNYGLEYIGIDPNKKLHGAYNNIVINHNIHNKSVILFDEPSEDIVYSKMVDTVFTSPPFFNIERYSKDDTQSWVRYKTLDGWLNEFLYRSIEKTWDVLNHTGFFIINISDVYSGHQRRCICDHMNDYIRYLGGKFIGDLSMKIGVRPQNRCDSEPIWIWQK